MRHDVRVAKNSIGSEGRTARLAARFQEARARLDGTVAGQILQRLREIDARARAVGLAGQAFIAFVPLAMLLAPWSLGENEPSFSVRVIDYLDLTGSTAEAVDVVFGTEPTVGGLSIAGVFVILLSLRALAQAYQRSWRSPGSCRHQLGARPSSASRQHCSCSSCWSGSACWARTSGSED